MTNTSHRGARLSSARHAQTVLYAVVVERTQVIGHAVVHERQRPPSVVQLQCSLHSRVQVDHALHRIPVQHHQKKGLLHVTRERGSLTCPDGACPAATRRVHQG